VKKGLVLFAVIAVASVAFGEPNMTPRPKVKLLRKSANRRA